MEKCTEASGGFRRDPNARLNRRPLRWGGVVKDVTVEVDSAQAQGGGTFPVTTYRDSVAE